MSSHFHRFNLLPTVSFSYGFCLIMRSCGIWKGIQHVTHLHKKQSAVWFPVGRHCKHGFYGLNCKFGKQKKPCTWEKVLIMAEVCLKLRWIGKMYFSWGNGDKEKWKKINTPVFPLLWMVLDSAVSLSQPSNCRFWYCSLTWVKDSSMSTGDCLALLQDGYLLPQLRWFRVPVYERQAVKWREEHVSWTADLKSALADLGAIKTQYVTTQLCQFTLKLILHLQAAPLKKLTHKLDIQLHIRYIFMKAHQMMCMHNSHAYASSRT